MQIVLLSGGSGKRLWPLSNETRSKQFLKLFKNNDQMESMIQRIYRQINDEIKNSTITIVASQSQKHMITNQIGKDTDILIEPARRNTFPAIMLTSAYLFYNKNIDINEPVIFMPIDSYVDNSFFNTFNEIVKIVKSKNIGLIGINPTYPSEKFGYIFENNNKLVFKEKPSKDKALKYIENNALWNSGVICTKLGYLINILNKRININSYEEAYNKFSELKEISFDCEVLEKEKSFDVIKYDGNWKDLGTWNTVTEEMGTESIGYAITGEECINTHIINELHIPIIALGTKDIVIAANPDGIFISDKNKSSYNKKYVDKLKDRVKYEERIWGRYTVLEENEKTLVKMIYVDKGKNLSYQVHKCRDEVWTIVRGEGFFVLNGKEKKIGPSDVLNIPRGSKHSIKAISDIEMVEVQLGSNFIEEDITRLDYTWKN